jgi:hypothetical protein
MVTEEGNGKAMEKRKGMGNGNGKWNGIVQQAPGGTDISHGIALQLQQEPNQADLNLGG